MHIRLLIFSIGITQFIAAQDFIEIPQTPPLEAVSKSSIAFADVDGDNDQDVLILGETSSTTPASELYLNDGTGIYTAAGGTGTAGKPEAAEDVSVAFADVDGDNDQDVIVAGKNATNTLISKLYTNDGTGYYTEVSGTPFEAVSQGSIAFADVDGDNDQDVLITGRNGSFSPVTKLYLNDGNGNFTEDTNTPFDNVQFSSVAFADVDGDNDQDVLIAGSSPGNISKLYTNDGSGNFTLVTGTPFEGVRFCSVAFADINGDNNQDLLITGRNSSNDQISKLYTNDGSGNYTEVSATTFDGVESSSIAFADVDSDNDQDVLLTGDTGFGNRISKIYTNDGAGTFTELTGTPFDGLMSSSVAFADVDGDNDQDVLITGSSNSGRISKLYRNTPSPAEETEIITACDNYTWRDQVTYTSSSNGVTYTVPNAAPNGADSIYTLNLTILNSTSSIDSHTECDSYTWIDGNTYTSSNNTATHTLTNVAGCDSVVTLDLTITNSTSGTDVQTTCDSYTWIDGNTYTSSNNTATHILTNAAGCDSVVTLDLTITNSTSGTDVQTACESFTWIDGNTYTTNNNTATYVLTNAVGCDSVVTLDLTLTDIDNAVNTNGTTITANLAGASYQWLDCDNGYAPISGETSQSFTATSNGNYAVEVSQNGCADTSDCVAITTVGLDDLKNTYGVHVYPNPASDIINIQSSQKIETVRLLNINGKLIKQTDAKSIAVGELNTGVYLIQITTSNGVVTKRIVKQ